MSVSGTRPAHPHPHTRTHTHTLTSPSAAHAARVPPGRTVRGSRPTEIETADAGRGLLLAMTLHITYVFEEGGGIQGLSH